MAADGGGDGAVQGRVVNGDIQRLDLRENVVPDVAGVLAVFEFSHSGAVLACHSVCLFAQVVDGELGDARVTGVIGLDQLDQRAGIAAVSREVHGAVIERDQAGAVGVGTAGLDLHDGVAHGDVGIIHIGVAVRAVGHEADVVGVQIAVLEFHKAAGDDADLAACEERAILKIVIHVRVGIGDIARALTGEAVGHAANRLGRVIGLAGNGLLDNADARHGILNVQGVGTGGGIRAAGVCGQSAPAGGDDQGVGIDALTCAEDVRGADAALQTERHGRALHHGNHKSVILLLGILGLLGIDNGAVDAEDAVLLDDCRGADDAVGDDDGILDREVGAALRQDRRALTLEIVRAVAGGADGHAVDHIVRRIDDDAVKERSVQVHFTAGRGGAVIGSDLRQKGRDRLVRHDAVRVHLQRGAVGVLRGVAAHVHEFGHLGIAHGAGRGLKGIGARLQRNALLEIVEDVVLVAVHDEGEDAAVFRLDYRAVRKRDGSDVRRRGRAVDGVVLRSRCGNILVAVGDVRDGEPCLAGRLRTAAGLSRRERGYGEQHAQRKEHCECFLHWVCLLYFIYF